MYRADAKEAAEILQRLLRNLSVCIRDKGRAGATARAAIGDLHVDAFPLLQSDAAGAPLDWCFQLVIGSSSTVADFAWVRSEIELEQPATLGGVLIKNVAMNLCLIAFGQIIAFMTFVSRSDVEAVMQSLLQPFADAEEIAADDMDSSIFQSLITLQATITNHLVQTALPLPRMLAYEFHEPLPSLVLAHRLYADASRADEIIAENKIVHPAFCPTVGRALSS